MRYLELGSIRALAEDLDRRGIRSKRAELEVSKIRFGLEGSVRAADLISPPAPTPPSIGDLISVEQGKPPPLQPAVSASAYIKGTF